MTDTLAPTTSTQPAADADARTTAAPPTAEDRARLTAATDFLDYEHERVTAFVDKALKGIDRETVDLVLGERRDRALVSSDLGGEDGEGEPASADRTAAERLLAKNDRALARVADPRQRRQRAYALLARHGFDPETCREVAATITVVAEE